MSFYTAVYVFTDFNQKLANLFNYVFCEILFINISVDINNLNTEL